MSGQVTVALGIGLYFLCLFKAPCHWFISPNRGGTFLREDSNGIKVKHAKCFDATEEIIGDKTIVKGSITLHGSGAMMSTKIQKEFAFQNI